MEAIYRYFEELRLQEKRDRKTGILEEARNIDSIDPDDPRFKPVE